MSQTYTKAQQRVYLDYIFGELWLSAKGLLRDRVVDQIAHELPGELRPISKVQAEFDSLPGIDMVGSDVILNVPSSGSHSLKLWLNLDITVNVSFSFSLTLHKDASPDIDHEIDIVIDLPWYWDVAVAAAGVASMGTLGLTLGLVPEFIEQVVGDILEEQFGGEDSELKTSLAMLSDLTYNHQASFEPHNASLVPVNTSAAEIGTILSSSPLDWIDIVFVADGYESSDISKFELATENFARVLLTLSNRLDNARLRAMSSVIRMWRLPIIGTDSNERITDKTKSNGSNVSSLRNLARLAEAGLRSEAFLESERGETLSLRPIIVVVRKDPSSTRAIALGEVILLPIKPSDNGKDAGSVLVHELGHSIGKLADEYTEGSSKAYMGTEPDAINVTILPKYVGTAPQWQKWLGKMPHASPSDTEYKVGYHFQGAYEFGSGIYRPANRCKMNNSGEDEPFCPVCEETYALGLLKRIGLNKAQANPPLTLEIKYSWPISLDEKYYTVKAPLTGGSSEVMELPVVHEGMTGDYDKTSLRVRVVRSAIPDHETTMQLLSDPPRSSEYVDVGYDDTVQLTVRPKADSPLPDYVKSSLSQKVVLHFNQELTFDLKKPTALTQTPRVPGTVYRKLNRLTGQISLSLKLGATSGGGSNVRQNTETVFLLESGSGQKFDIAINDPMDSVTKHAINPNDILEGGLPIGKYTWGACSRLPGTNIQSDIATLARSGGYHFEVKDVQVDSYSNLPTPLDVFVKNSGYSHPEIVQVLPDFDMRDKNMEPGMFEAIYDMLKTEPGIHVFDPDPDLDHDAIDIDAVADPDPGPGPDPIFPSLPGSSDRHRAGLGRRRSGRTKSLKSNLIYQRVRVYTEKWKHLPHEEGIFIPRFSNNESLGLAIGIHEITKNTCAAFAYHPEGKPMLFEFEFQNIGADFTGDNVIPTGMLSPAKPHKSYLVVGQISFMDSRIQDTLNKTSFKIRVRTIDEQGIKSNWLVKEDPLIV